MQFDDAVKELRTVAPGRVTVVSYDGLKFALDCGIDVRDFAETYTLQAVIRDHGTPAQKQRLREEIIAGRWATEIAWAGGQQRSRGLKRAVHGVNDQTLLCTRRS